MPKFNFQLDGVLKHRRRVEQERKREMAAFQSRVQEFESELRLLNEQVEVSSADVKRNHLTGRLDLNYLAAHRRHMIGLQRRALTLMQQMSMVQRQVEESRKRLAHAAKQRRGIERLREKHRERWLAAMGRRELSEQDEISMQLSYWQSIDEAEPVL